MSEKEKEKEEKPLKQRWLQMGVELEGSWDIPRAKVAELVRGAKAVVDKSVKIGIGDPGEIITRPHADLNALLADVAALWPQHVHTSCGFHIHASFTPMDASMIACADFFKFYKESWHDFGKKMGLSKNHEFWSRLGGRNPNARDEFLPERQLIPTPDGRGMKMQEGRKTMLNFHSWELHKTVESRLLPMFSDSAVGVEAVRHQAWIYDHFLNHHGFRPLKFELVNQIQGEKAIERYESKNPDMTPINWKTEEQFPHLERGENIYYSIRGATDDMLPWAPDTGKQTA